jgi:hypothetical protein
MTGLVRQPRGMSEVPVRVSEEPMKIRIISSALAVSAVTLIAGAAFSGGVKSSDSELVDFDQKSGRLWAVPQHGNVAEFEHTPQTIHLEGDLGRYIPPNPCFELGHLWNFTVRYDRHYNTDSRAIYESLLTLMAQNSCGATITAVSGSPPPITSIAPNAAK